MRIAVIAALLAASPARADVRSLQGAAWLHYELTALHDVDETAERPAARDVVLAGVRLHGMVSKNRDVGFHVGLDLAAGGTVRGGGFAYDVALFPLGVGVRFGESSLFALGTGVGATGATGTLDDAVTLPVEATLEWGSGRVRVLARGRVAWLAGAPGRHDGAPSIAFADELDAQLGVRVGHHWTDYGFPSGAGYFVGAAYRELLGTRFVGIVLGHSLDIATRRRAR